LRERTENCDNEKITACNISFNTEVLTLI